MSLVSVPVSPTPEPRAEEVIAAALWEAPGFVDEPRSFGWAELPEPVRSMMLGKAAAVVAAVRSMTRQQQADLCGVQGRNPRWFVTAEEEEVDGW